MEEAKILKAITHSISCDKCPNPCKVREQSSQYNCDRHWFDMLKLFSRVSWDDIREKLHD